MGRVPRADVAGGIYHMLNRANRRSKIFKKPADYESFERILDEAVSRYQLELFSYCLMPNHWHLCVRPLIDGEMSRFAQWLGLTHTQRYNVHYKTVGQGHLYQGRYKSFPVQGDGHFLTVCRYIERNAYTAELCESPEAWRFGSLCRWKSGTKQEKSMLAKWPIARVSGWAKHVASVLSSSEIKQLECSEKRGCPFGDESWVEMTTRKFGLETTMRPRGRPRKFPATLKQTP